MSKRSILMNLVVISMCFAFSLVAIGQEITGNIVGTVRDTNGAGVPNATVTITDPSKNNLVVRTVVTNSDGEFSAPNLPTSTFSVTVEAPNFKKSVNTGVKVDVGARRSLDVTLQAGRIEEIVTVQADAVAVDLTSAKSATVINGNQVRELSINNRNWVQLVLLAPGVSNDLTDSVTTGTTTPETGTVNTIQISVNGARSSQNTYTVDGADVTDRGSNLTIQAYPSVDSIGEFSVLRSLYPAESGRSGGGQINVVTRSGAAKFHGSAFEFIRNDALNANDFISNSNPALATTLGRKCAEGTVFVASRSECKLRRRSFRYNDFGWTLGGPVYLPNFGEHDPGDSFFKRSERTFFFFSQEFRKDKRAPIFASTVPTSGLKQGIFTVPVCLQATGTTCNLILPANTPMTTPGPTFRPISPVAQQYINLIYNKLPDPDNPTTFLLNRPIESTLDFRQEVVKIDHSFSDKLGMYYRYQRDNIPTIDGNAIFSSGSNLPGVSTLSTNSPGRTHTIQTTYAASSSLIFEARYTYGYGAIKDENVGSLALTNSPIAPTLAYPKTVDRVPSLTGNGFSGLVGQGAYDNFSFKKNLGGTVTWISGNHTMKFGAVYSKYRKRENQLGGNNEGIFDTINIPGTNVATITGFATAQQNWANFLQGTNLRFTQASFDYIGDFRQQAFESFAQDEWKFRSNLTLSLGVRYSYFGPTWDKNGRLSNFVPDLWSAASAPQVRGDGTRVVGTGNFCNGIIINSQNTGVTFPNCTPTVSPFGKYVNEVTKANFAPRLGLSWDPFGNGKTAIRTGYGIYHEQVLAGALQQNIGQNAPYQQTCRVTGVSLDNPVPVSGCPVIALTNTSSVRAWDPHFKTPYMQQWSLDVQQQLTKKTIVTAGYYGSKGTHLIGGYELNLLRPGDAISRGATGCAVGASTTPTAPCQAAGAAFYSAGATAILDQIRPYRGYSSIQMVQSRYNSNYHSLQISAQHRFTEASQVNLAYTWAKNLTDAQNDRSTSPQNIYDIRTEKGRAALDRRQIFSMNYIYELPFYRDQKGFVGKTLGGWQASGIITYNTGLPFTPTVTSFDKSGLGTIPALVAGTRPTLLCNPNVGAPHTRLQWFNTACFQITPVAGSAVPDNNIGNGGRGIVLGPPTKRVDLTLAKNIRFGESFNVQLRGEAFNVFNFVNFRGLNTAVWTTATAPVSSGGNGSSVFGSVSTVRDPRVIQLAAKFSF